MTDAADIAACYGKSGLSFLVTRKPAYATFTDAAMFLIRSGFRATGFDGAYHYFTKNSERMRVPDIAHDYQPLEA